MFIEYDGDVDAAFVWLTTRPQERAHFVESEFWPEELQGKIGLLFDKEKRRLVGLEVLETSIRLLPELLDGHRSTSP